MPSGEPDAPRRSIVYCIVPSELAGKLHELLRRHFREAPGVEVVVEQRGRSRRRSGERRAETVEPETERRRIHATDGRRVADRRTALMPVESPPGLPRRARPHLAELLFFERLEPTSLSLEDADTARLVARFQAGDRDVFAILYLRYFDRVYSYLRIALDEDHEAEDSAQQVFLKVFQALERYERRKQPFRAWLFVVVRNQALEHLRKSRRVDVVDDVELHRRRERPDETTDLSSLDWVSDGDLVLFLERLPAPQRQVLLLRYMLDLEFTEIARVLDRTATDVRMLHHRAVRFLESRLTAIGRRPRSTERGRVPMGRGRKQYGVLRARRFVLTP